MSVEVPVESAPQMVREMHGVALPPEIEDLIDHYGRTTSDRDELLWKWLYYVFPSFQLSTVPSRYASPARNAKFCFSFFMTVLDDLSERHRDRPTFEQGRNIPFDATRCDVDAPGADLDVLALLVRSWEMTEEYLQVAPRHGEFRELLEFDLRQSLNTMDFNRLVNEEPRLASETGADLYDTHNMLLYVYVDIDLAFSPAFDVDDLATLRDVTWEAMQLARIGNWVTTWERELEERDYTSKVVVDAVRGGVVTWDELTSELVPTEEVVTRIQRSGIEHDLLVRWNRLYRDLLDREYDVESLDVHAFVDGMRRLLEIDVKARGYK